MDDFDYLQELTQLQETINFINRGPFTTEILSEDHIAIYDKDGKLVMALGKYWIEK